MNNAVSAAGPNGNVIDLDGARPIIEDRTRIASGYTKPISVVADSRWDLSPLWRKSTVRDCRSISFEAFPACFQATAKRVVWALLNLATPIEELDRSTATRTRLAPSSVMANSHLLRNWMQWLTDRGVTSFVDVTPEHFELYAAHVAALGLDRSTQANRLFAVTRTWLYAPYLPESDRLGRPSWEGGEARKKALGEANWSAENRTPPIHPQTMSALLVWSMRFVNDFSGDIIASKTLTSTPADPGPELGALPPYKRFLRYLEQCRQSTGTIPGHLPTRGDSDHNVPANEYIAWKLGLTARYGRSMALSVRVPDLDPTEDADLPLPVVGTIDGQPWAQSINFYDVDKLCRLLATACFVIVAYLTGMRGEECRALEQGCCRTIHNPRTGLTRYLLIGRTFKAALDAEGNTIPEGAEREQPWQAIAPVAQAVAVMERLQPGSRLLFSAKAFAAQTLTAGSANAVTANTIRNRIAELIDWCNQQAELRGRVHEVIPEDSEGPVVPRRFRRTLAWFVYRKPGGRIALGVQYGHLRGHTTDGYGSRVSSGLRDVFPMEEALAAAEFLTDSHTRLQEGEQVTGPAAERYTEGIQLYHNMFGGRHLTGRQAAALRANPKLRIYDNEDQFVTCCYDQAKALCHPQRQTSGNVERTPDITNCRPNCGNVARTDTNIARAEAAVAQHLSEIDSAATPLPLRARLEQRVITLQAIIDKHRQKGGGQ